MTTVNSISGGRSSGYMAMHYRADVNLFVCVEIEDRRCTPADKKLVQIVSDKLGHEFIATAEDDLTLTAVLELEQMMGSEIKWLSERSYESLFRQKAVFGGKPNRLPSWARRYCTQELKLVPIFKYVHNFMFANQDDRVAMRIGYRSGEESRVKSYNEGNRNIIRFPVSCDVVSKRQTKRDFYWRDAEFLMVRDLITHFDVLKYWQGKSIVFPPQSNCVGCFHKDELSINLQWKHNPAKMQWFADQEERGMGTWRDNKIKYAQIKDWNFPLPIDFGMAGVCDSGGCTD